jgi:hypothetical protein
MNEQSDAGVIMDLRGGRGMKDLRDDKNGDKAEVMNAGTGVIYVFSRELVRVLKSPVIHSSI